MLGLPKFKAPREAVFFVGFPILSQVRKLGGKNDSRFTDLRTIKKKRLEI